MSTFNNGDLQIFFEIAENCGDEIKENTDWITLVNGHTRTSTDFRMMAKTLAAKGFRVLCLDNRASGKTVSSGDFSLNDLAGDIVSLWNHLKIRKSHIVGISMGGVICQVLAHQHFDRVLKMSLVSTFGEPRFVRKSAEGWGDSLDETLIRLQTYFADQFFIKNRLLVVAMAKQIRKQIDAGSFLNDANRQRKAMDEFSFDSINEIDERIEALIIHGESDQIIDVAASEELLNKFSKGTLLKYEGCGHLLLAESAKRLYQDIGEFFSK